MGRIQRKKDPSKKKALREIKTETDAAETSSGEAPAQPKLASVAKKSAVSSKARCARTEFFAQEYPIFTRGQGGAEKGDLAFP